MVAAALGAGVRRAVLAAEACHATAGIAAR
jgi:hypothetical protein